MNKHSPNFRHLAALALLTLTAAAQAQSLKVQDAWVRATVPQQQATGAFMQLSSAQGGKLVELRSPAAKVVEVHEMSMENNVMKMRALPFLELPAGQSVELKPGGYHIMLMGLNGQVKAGESVPLTLVFEGRDGKRETLELKAPAQMAPGAMMHKH